MEMFLDECGPDTVIDDEIIQEIALNRSEGLDMMKLLIRRQQAGFAVTEHTLCNAARENGPEMMELLVNNAGGSDLLITRKILREVAGNCLEGESVLEYLYNLRGHDLPVSEKFLVYILDHNLLTGGSMLEYLLERWPELPVTDRLLVAACLNPYALDLLLNIRHDCLPIKRMIQELVTGYGEVEKSLMILLDRQIVKVDDWLVEMAAGNEHALKVIYNRAPKFPVTPVVIVKAANSSTTMRILLDRLNDQVSITEEFIKSALRGSAPYSTVNLLLTRLSPRMLPITEEILIDAIGGGNMLCLELFLEHYRDLDLTAVWQAMWEDPEISPFNLARAAVYFLQYVKFDLSDRMLEKLPAEYNYLKSGSWLFYPFDDLIRSYMRHRISLPTTDLAIELILARSSLNTIDIFLEDHPDIRISQRQMEAAKNNPREGMDKDALMTLLESRSNLSSLSST